MDPLVAARQMDTDEIVPIADLRDWLAALVEMAWQATGRRRTKNARIWSLHDLDALAGIAGARAQARASAPTPVAHAQAQVADGALVVRAPMSGRFYTRPAPGQPSFVAAGDEVGPQKTVGLLEVMKTFNRITYGGDGLPSHARVVRVIAADGSDLRAGDPILEVEALGEPS
jgi:biotin carboxyl carrier protein